MPARIDELGVAKPHRQRALVHARDERDAEMVGDRPAGVVRGAHHHRGQERAHAQLLAGLESDAAAGLARGREEDCDGDYLPNRPLILLMPWLTPCLAASTACVVLVGMLWACCLSSSMDVPRAMHIWNFVLSAFWYMLV